MGEAIADRLDRCAVIDVDDLRGMVSGGHRAPWEGEEGAAQHELGAKNASLLARNFNEAGFDVVILDAVSDGLIEVYRRDLGGLGLRVVQLLPTQEEVERRNRSRPVLTEDEVRWVYGQQLSLSRPDERIDNTSLPPAEVAERLLAREGRG